MDKLYRLPLVMFLFLFSAMLVLPVSSLAQGRVQNYVNFPPFNGAYNTIVGQAGTTNLYVPNCGGCGYTYGYTNYSTFSAPFAFNYDSTAYPSGTTMYAYWDGALGFGAGNPNGNYEYGNGAGYNLFPNMIFPWGGTYLCCWQYGYYDNYGYSGGIYTNVTGAVGSRILTVEWHGFGLYGYYAYYYGYYMNMQVKIYEATNNIEFYYSPTNYYMYYGYAPTVGLNGSTTGAGGFKSLVITSGTDYNFTTYYTPPKNYQLQCPVPPPNVQLSAQPKVLTFQNSLVGTAVTQNIVIKNAGTDPIPQLSITGTSIVGNSDFSVLSTPGPLAPGASANMVVQFQPIVNGSRSAILTIKSNGRDSANQTITLNGVGLAPLIATDTNILFKKNFVKMGQSLTKRLMVTNTGTGILIWNNFTFSGADADQFSITRNPMNPIPVGGQDSMLITYTPTREGRHTSTMTINSNALNIPALPIQLIGNAILPHILVTPNPQMTFDSTFEGDSAFQQFTISNPGTDTLRISPNMLSSNDGDFTITALTGSDTAIPPDKFKNVGVLFKPKQLGTRLAKYFLKTNIIKTFEAVPRDTAGSISINITGTGVPFGVLAQTLGGATYDTTIKGTQVCRMDSIWNRGDADLTITGWNLSGSNASDFTVTGLTFPHVLKARSFVLVTICGMPSDLGLRTANLTINGKSNGRNQTISLALNVYGQKVCDQADPSALFAGELVVEGTDSSECVTVTNCGEVPAVYTAKLSGSGSADYTLTSPPTSATVAPTATATFCVKFHPTTMTSANSSLTISSPDLTDIVVPITGSGACAALTATAATYPSNPSMGGHYIVSVPVQNAGNYPWTLGTPVITPAGSAYSFTTNPAPATLAPGNVNLLVNFDPTAITTTYTAQITFPNASPACANTLSIDLSAQTGTESVAQKTEQDGFSLGQNYPNPFSLTTTFNYTTPNEAPVSITISDVTGHLVKTISTGRVSAGEHQVSIDATEFASGTYVVSLSSGSVTLSRQMVVTK